jgi:hypothetical protein
LSASPFGWPRLLVAHLVMSVPLSLLVAQLLSLPLGRPSGDATLWGWAAAGLGSMFAFALLGPSLAEGMDALGLGFTARGLVRSAVCVLIEVPWLMLGVRGSGGVAVPPVSRVSLAVAALVAVVPPMAYTNQVVRTRGVELATNLDTGRLVRGSAILEGLWELGDRRDVGGLSPVQARRSLAATRSQLHEAARQHLPRGASATDRLDRAFLMIQLDQLDEAEALLLPIVSELADAALLLGAIYRDQGRWAESVRTYREVLDRLRPHFGRDADTESLGLTAYDGLAEAAVLSGRPEDAEQAYLEAARAMPTQAAHFAFQLGRHYQNGGRPLAAIAQFENATRLDPAYQIQTAPLIRRLRVQTPACVLPRGPQPTVFR